MVNTKCIKYLGVLESETGREAHRHPGAVEGNIMVKSIQNSCLVAIVALLAWGPYVAYAKSAGDIMVRVRAIGVLPSEGGAADDGTAVINGDTDLDDNIVPEIDFTYFITSNIGIELILATTRHQAEVAGSTLGDVRLGEVSLLPPTLTLQYHPFPNDKYSPYFGVGVNYTITYDVNKGGGSNAVTVNNLDFSDEFGFALQAGIDIQIKDNWYFNFDVKKIFVETDINLNQGSVKVDGANIDPWVIGIGFGYLF